MQGASSDIALGAITIGGRMELANILAGYAIDGSAANGDAQIVSVKVGGDFIASNIVAGVENPGSGDANFGDGGDQVIAGGSPNITATIGSVTIGGMPEGTPASTSTSDHFGIVSQVIGPVSIGGTLVTLAPDVPLGTTADVDLVAI